MDWQATIFSLIDSRSFSNLWYWVGLAVIWSGTGHWILGVPYDLIVRAKRNGGQAIDDLTDLVRVNTSRILYIADEAGIAIVAFGSFFLVGIGMLAWGYSVEFAQALFLLAFPMSIVALLNVRAARKMQAEAQNIEDVYKMLNRHRVTLQVLGVVSIFVTAIWGMYVNFAARSILG